MDSDRGRVDESVETNTSDDSATEIQHTNDDVSTRLQQLEQSQVAMQLLADPDIQRVIEAKRQGKPLKISTEVEAPPADEPSSLTRDLPDDDPMKETLSKIEKTLVNVVESRMSPLLDRLQAIEGFAGEAQKKEVQTAVAVAQKKFSDFNEYRGQMLELAKTNQNLQVDELYLLAKSRAGKLKLPEQSTFSEKPTSQPRRPTTNASDSRKAVTGRAAWNQTLQKALEGLSLDSGD